MSCGTEKRLRNRQEWTILSRSRSSCCSCIYRRMPSIWARRRSHSSRHYSSVTFPSPTRALSLLWHWRQNRFFSQCHHRWLGTSVLLHTWQGGAPSLMKWFSIMWATHAKQIRVKREQNHDESGPASRSCRSSYSYTLMTPLYPTFLSACIVLPPSKGEVWIAHATSASIQSGITKWYQRMQ